MENNIEKQFISICEKAKLVGASTVIIKDDKIIENINYGYEDREHGIKVSDDTIYRIASVSKMEVAVCIMQLYEKGLVDLDTDISKYLGFSLRNPNFPNDIITIRMLMSQTSSITDGYDTEEGDLIDTGYLEVICLDHEVGLEELLVPGGKYYVNETFAKYAPGQGFKYANFNCGILACILERVTKEYFFDYVKKNVLEPLGVKGSFVANDLKDEHIASTYSQDLKLIRSKDDYLKHSMYHHKLGHNFVGPAGGLFVSALGLSKIMKSYINYGEKILKKETFSKMLEVVWHGNRNGNYSAKGLQMQIIDDFGCRRLYGHLGSAYGVKSFMLFSPFQKLGFVFITNGGSWTQTNSGFSDVQSALIKIYLDAYWENKTHHLEFKIGDDQGLLDGVKFKINYLPPERQVLSKRPYLDVNTMIHAFSLNASLSKKEMEDICLGKHLFEILAYADREYEYDYYVKEEYPNGDIKNNNDVVTYFYCDYKLKEKKDNNYLEYNYHTHCNYCDHAKGDIEEYVLKAIDSKYSMLGMSDHGPLPYSFLGKDNNDNDGYIRGQMNYNKFINSYIPELDLLKEKYKDEIKIEKALEIEYISGHDEYYKDLLSKLDYLLYGAHFTYGNNNYIGAYFGVNSDNVIEYAREVVKGIESGFFKILVHPDLYMYRYISTSLGLRGFDEEAKKAANMIIDACDKCGVMMELNVGGVGKGENVLDNGCKEYSYPRTEFWSIVSKHPNIKVVIGCDAHDKRALACNNIKKIIDFAKKMNIKVINLKSE